MVYGSLIFIKKTGGDGSKYPVTEKNTKIGRSKNCLIRIYTPEVAPEHCQLIIDSNGQAKLRNLFTSTILNGKSLGQGDVTLCHGDVFKLGERLARWEYLPTSKYFKQLLSPTGRLIAVVNPQRRSMEMSGISATQASGSKSTPLRSKRKFSEKFSSENSSMAKQRRTIGSDASFKPKLDFGKVLIGHCSIKTGKSMLKTPVLKQRKSVSGIINSRTLQKKAKKQRKSTLPSWKVSVGAGTKQSTQIKKSPSKRPVKTPPKRSLKNEVRTPSKSTPIKVKTPKRLKLDAKSGDKTVLNTILESPAKLEPVRSTRSFSKSPPAKVLSTPKRRSPVKAARLVKSEKKSKATPKLGGFRKMSLILKKMDEGGGEISGRKSVKEKNILSVENESQVRISSSEASNASVGRKSSRSDTSINSSKKTSRESVKSTTEKTPRNLNKPSNQSSVKKSAVKIAQTPSLINLSCESDSVDTEKTFRESVNSSRKSLKKSVRKSSARSADIFQTPQKFSKNAATPSVEKTREGAQRSDVASPVSTPGNRKPRNASLSKRGTSLLKGKSEPASPKGVRRKLSPSISSAERAAKKLKTSSPKKPDKNKRAALLVLGKASRKQLLSQNVKVLLKQKIVKKAIKQSVALPIRKDEKKKTPVKKIRKKLQKKKKKTGKVSSPSRTSQTVKESPASMEKSINEFENDTPSVKKSPERSSLSKSKVSSPLTSTKVATPNTETVKSATKSNKKAESILSPKSTNETISPFIKFDKSSESYVFSSSRRCSKRLSSKNDTERPDFVELSPTALGLIPKNIEMFKTPKERKRKSSSLVTPRNNVSRGIIKSASTSKIGNRKSVSFLSKDFSANTTAYTPTLNEKTDFDFDSFHTSNITMDVFVSPLNKSSGTPFAEFVTDENVEPSEKRSSPGSKKVARKLLQSPQNDRASKSSKFSDQTKTPRTSVSESSAQNPVISSRSRSSPKNDLTDVRGVKKLFETPKAQRSPKNDLSDLRGVKKLMRTPRVQKSPKNDLSDLRGVKKLMQTPRVQKSPKNDISDVRGVKKLMGTPKMHKSPKNDLSDVRGVKKLMRTPKTQKSPKNDLSDVRGVKKLMRTPKTQKSPRNDLSDVRGVKKLMGTPKMQKSPRNDLSDVRGVKKLMRTPKTQKSPRNNLSDVRGVKKLMRTPKTQKSPRNDLSDVRGVKKLMRTPKSQSSPKNDLSDLRGVKKLMQTPKKQKSPKNDLTDVAGVKQLLRTPDARNSPQNSLSDVEGIKELFASPPTARSPSEADQKIRKTAKSLRVRKLPWEQKPTRKCEINVISMAKSSEMYNSEQGEMESEAKKSPLVSESKPKRGRKQKLDEGKNQEVTTAKTRVKKGSAKVKTPRVTRSAKQEGAEKEVSKGEAVGGRKTTRVKTAEPLKKTTRRKVEAKKEAPKAEASKTNRKRKIADAVEATPPKVGRKAAAAGKQSTSKESKTVAVRSAARKAEAESGIKGPEKTKMPAKKAAAGQSKATRSVTSASKTEKVQKGRSQRVVKQKSGKSETTSPRKTRAAAAKS